MDSLINNPYTFGKLNCTLVFNLGKQELKAIYEEIVELFEPESEEFSAFDLQDFEMNDFEISKPFEDDQLIRKVIFTKGNNKIILEYYSDKYAIGHLVGLDDNETYEGWEVIKKYACEFKNIALVCGYELSLDVDEYPQSLNKLIDDDSLHPLMICYSTESNRFLITVHDSISDSLSSSKKDRIRKYIELLNLPMV